MFHTDPCDGLAVASPLEGVKKLTPGRFNYYRDCDKLWPDGPLGSHTDFQMQNISRS